MFNIKIEYNLPDNFFINLTSQQKPIYIDINNPFLVEIFFQEIANVEDVIISEMLPNIEDLHLKDENGKYCSEFRLEFFKS